ncbi:hypothetical protein GYMLUDRAFT_244612 [Collybiopsis luxurians FD-317 M1]|uniref:Uncharacterized protein n=1 Tax=Collybiopsis luxurians FD-317 M1 TaxID=944289 RepID=A0A0D0BWZ7_9AGAR|nr:hypothetical protein GYMLUDRAFT_244612 [Collybiopsis luxurians FD-317 M1]
MSLRNISFSNKDTNHLQYASFIDTWLINGVYNATNTGQSGTLSSTNDNSANVTFGEHFFKPTLFNPKETPIEFHQAATAVYYYGIRRCCGGFYAVCIDCNPNAPFTSDSNTGFQAIDAVNASDNGNDPPVVLWSQTFPSPAVHSVRMKTPGGAAGGTQSSVTFIMPFTARESGSNNYVTITETAREATPGRAPGADDAGVWPTEQPVNERTPEVNPYETNSDSGTLLPPAYDEISFENV